MVKSFKVWLSIWLWVIVAGLGNVEAIESDKRELQWAYIMHFIHYISWPDSQQTPVVKICVVGSNPFTVIDQDILVNKKTGSMAVTHYYDLLPEIVILEQCNVIYFSHTISLAQLSFVFSKLAEQPIVTIGDNKAFVKIGGLIQFTEKDKKLRFSINKPLLNSLQLKIHPSVLRLSD